MIELIPSSSRWRRSFSTKPSTVSTKMCGESSSSSAETEMPLRSWSRSATSPASPERLVGDADPGHRRVDVQLELLEALAGRLAHPVDLLARALERHRSRIRPRGSAGFVARARRSAPRGRQGQGPATAAADEERRVRPLGRLRLGVVIGDRVVLAGEAERPVGEAPLQDGDRLGQPCLADRGRVECHADRLVLGPVPARADRHVQPPLGEDVEARQLLRQHRGVPQVVVQHEGRDPEPIRDGRDRRHRRDRRQLLDEVIGDDERVDADRLRPTSRLGQLANRGDLACVGEEAEGSRHSRATGRPRRTPRAPAERRGRGRRSRPPRSPLPSPGVRSAATGERRGSAAVPCSERMTCMTALISARCVKACGKLPRWRPVSGSSSSP